MSSIGSQLALEAGSFNCPNRPMSPQDEVDISAHIRPNGDVVNMTVHSCPEVLGAVAFRGDKTDPVVVVDADLVAANQAAA